MPALWGASPKQSIEAECGRRGKVAVVRGCMELLTGQDTDDDLIHALGGPAATAVLDGREGGRTGYWPRVWAARGLLHAWSDEASTAIQYATADESWRVREMAAKVVAKHRLDEALNRMLDLRDDPVPRVAAAAQRAIRELTSAGQ